MKRSDLLTIKRQWFDEHCPYSMTYFLDFDYSCLKQIMYIRRAGRGQNTSYNDVIIMADTETSKKPDVVPFDDYHEEIKKDLSFYTFKYDNRYASECNCTKNDFIHAGFRFGSDGRSKIDVYYEDLKSRYPWIFKDDAYSELDAIYYIYEYLKDYEAPTKRIDNHVVAWTLSIRAFNRNIVTLYGHKPSELTDVIYRINKEMPGEKTIIYFHNLAYDWVFLRLFIFDVMGYPEHQLNTKPHYPIYIEFANGVILKDSLILAQRGLEKWADDLDVEHKKAVGSWDYDKFRCQSDEFTEEELHYIENDTLAGVECLQKTMDMLHKHIYSMPYTATGIPREQVIKRSREHNGREKFKKQALNYDQYLKILNVYHGGYTHGNRHHVNQVITGNITCFDFASSYPYCLLSQKYPAEKFTAMPDTSAEFIIQNMDDFAYMFKLTMIKPRLKNDFIPMPVLQYSKCTKSINAVLDNGRILCADYIEIYINEMDLAVIWEQYDCTHHLCSEVEFAAKSYLPRWFTDYVYECFTEKCFLKNGDPVAYSLSKARVNSLYGMTVQRSIREDIVEDYETGEYETADCNPEEDYEKYLNKYTSVLPFQWGCWVTSSAFYNLHQLGKCAGSWLYSDTDSIYGTDWDMGKVEEYNKSCREKLLANNYGPVVTDDDTYWLGVATVDGEYTEFKYLGAKRYCCRKKKNGELKLTVAGVPKEKGVKCLNNDINNFVPGFIFDGSVTGKKLHTYVKVDKIYIDEAGNETGDSIDLTPDNYTLDTIETYDWEQLMSDEVSIQVYEEE